LEGENVFRILYFVEDTAQESFICPLVTRIIKDEFDKPPKIEHEIVPANTLKTQQDRQDVIYSV